MAALIAAGLAYARLHGMADAYPTAPVLAGAGTAAIGLNLATGIRLARRNVRGLPAAAVATGLGIGVVRFNPLLVLIVMIPASLGVVLLRRRR